MAKIMPYRGVHYNPEKIRNLSDVITQPYDKITPSMQDIYYRRNPYNIVRLILGKGKPEDDDKNNKYIRASEYLEKWIQEDVLMRDNNHSFYPSFQEFQVGGKTYVRKGFVALLDMSDADVKAHEKTLAGPKIDRLHLFRATQAFLEHIFILFPDPEKKVLTLLNRIAETQLANYQALGEYSVKHHLWSVTESELVKELQSAISDKTLFIADGHHRFETSVNYMNEMKPHLDEFEEPESPRYRQVTLVPIEQDGLVVLPTHRLIHSVKDFSLVEFITKMGDYFTIEKFAASDRDTFFKKLGDKGKGTFGFVPNGSDEIYLMTTRDFAVMDEFVSGSHSKIWKQLDVTVLHTFLDHFLGIDKKALEEYRNILYLRGIDEAYELMNKMPEAQGVFFLNATRVDEVKAIALSGERMPQKSTDFFPKLATGLVMDVMIKR